MFVFISRNYFELYKLNMVICSKSDLPLEYLVCIHLDSARLSNLHTKYLPFFLSMERVIEVLKISGFLVESDDTSLSIVLQSYHTRIVRGHRGVWPCCQMESLLQPGCFQQVSQL